MEAKTLLMLASALILLSLGIVHLVYTFWGPKLLPRDPALIDSMKAVYPVITTETTVWKSWIGFNASHSMAAILFGLVYGYLVIANPGVLYGSMFLQAVGFFTLAGFVVLAWVYWFSVPFLGVSLSLVCYVASLLLALLSGGTEARIVREDFFVASEPGVRLFVREIRLDDDTDSPRTPVLLLHGARVPSVPSFDLPVQHGSLAASLARAGHVAYLMDAVGYGESTRPSEMAQPPDAHAPLVRSAEVVRDIAAVVERIRRRTGSERVALLGWATGGHWLGYYATLHPDRVSHLILYNTLYAGSSDHPRIGHGSALEDPTHPGRFNDSEFGAYRLNTRASLFRSWDRSIPVEDKTSWRDPQVAAIYAELALKSDPTSFSRTPPSFRAPTGALEDSYYLATGRQLWDASLIRSPTLILASEHDFWSRPEDRTVLQDQLVHAPKVKVVVLPEATHYVHLDRPERGRSRFLRTVLSFLAGPA